MRRWSCLKIMFRRVTSTDRVGLAPLHEILNAMLQMQPANVAPRALPCPYSVQAAGELSAKQPFNNEPSNGGIVALGVAAAVSSTRLLASFLYRLEPNDPTTLVTACVVLAVSAVVAGLLPARRAAILDPMTALREE